MESDLNRRLCSVYTEKRALLFFSGRFRVKFARKCKNTQTSPRKIRFYSEIVERCKRAKLAKKTIII